MINSSNENNAPLQKKAFDAEFITNILLWGRKKDKTLYQLITGFRTFSTIIFIGGLVVLATNLFFLSGSLRTLVLQVSGVFIFYNFFSFALSLKEEDLFTFEVIRSLKMLALFVTYWGILFIIVLYIPLGWFSKVSLKELWDFYPRASGGAGDDFYMISYFLITIVSLLAMLLSLIAKILYSALKLKEEHDLTV